MSGVDFEIIALRVTREIDGVLDYALLRTHPFMINLSPIVEVGKLHASKCGCATYREPDTFQGFEMTLSDRRLTWRRDRKLWRLLRKGAAIEFWTSNEDEQNPWVHWLFPHTTWRKTGIGVYEGLTHEGEGFITADVPDGMPITSGGYWKTADPPPGRRP